MNTKRCPSCKKVKPITSFGARITGNKPRLQSYCIVCRNKKHKKTTIKRSKKSLF